MSQFVEPQTRSAKAVTRNVPGHASVKITIVIPVYNAARTVGQTLESLQQIQDGWDHVDQVLLCDDASTDNSLEVIRSSRFDRCPLTVLRHPVNRGESAAYDTMIARFSKETDWFLILHADDLAMKNFIVRNVEIVLSCDESVASVASNYWVFDEETEALAAEEKDIVYFRRGTEQNVRLTAVMGSWWHISGALVNKQKWVEFGGRNPALPYLGDWDLCLRWQLHGYTVGMSAIATTKYRQSVSTSLSSSAYLYCRDFLERLYIASSLPEVFDSRLLRNLGFNILKGCLRRAAKFLLSGRISLAGNACKVGAQSFLRLAFR